MLQPFLARVRGALGVSAALDAPAEARLAMQLAARVAEVRWGAAARDELMLRNDPDVQAALASFPRLSALLGRAGR
ncbi:MAG: hypothetical protein IRZ00_06300 [Gemmatimonadetes bacterium]|nr:hypothetical protein [Gemmatimonadota bacterium]